MTAKQTLDREFLEMRCRLIDLASSLDRIHRGSDPADVAADPRWGLLHQAASILTAHAAGRAEKMQLLFSDPYVPQWRGEFAMDTRKP